MFTKEGADALIEARNIDAYTLYDSEVGQLPRLSREEQRELVERARKGEKEARHLLVLNCLHWAFLLAHRIYDERQPQHIDILDLAAEANLKMLERIEKALTANDPVAYLMTIAAQRMRVYCTYHAPLIQRSEGCSRQELATINQFSAPMESLDKPLLSEENQLMPRQVKAPALVLESDERREQRTCYHFAPVYEAIKRLNRPQRATMIRLYGLYGQPAETLSEIALTSHQKYHNVVTTAYRARCHLEGLLAEYLPQLCCHRPAPEEQTVS